MDPSLPTQKSSQLPPSMERLHAYWRMPYILAPKNSDEGGNPFTRITETGDDAKEYILQRGTHNYIVMNRYPYNAGHLLVLPFREVPRLEDLLIEERHELMDLPERVRDPRRRRPPHTPAHPPRRRQHRATRRQLRRLVQSESASCGCSQDCGDLIQNLPAERIKGDPRRSLRSARRIAESATLIVAGAVTL